MINEEISTSLKTAGFIFAVVFLISLLVFIIGILMVINIFKKLINNNLVYNKKKTKKKKKKANIISDHLF